MEFNSDFQARLEYCNNTIKIKHVNILFKDIPTDKYSCSILFDNCLYLPCCVLKV